MRKVIKQLKVNETIKDYFLLTNIQTKLGKNGTYLEMVLADASGEMKARKWDLKEQDYQFYELVAKELPKIVLVKGFTREFQQSLDLKVFYLVLPNEDDKISIQDFIPTAHMKVDEAFDKIEASLLTIKDKVIFQIVEDIYKRYKPSLAQYPASLHNHSSYGGLLWHTVNTIELCKTVATLYPMMLNVDLLIGAAILHDLAKVKDYKLEKGVITKVTDQSKFVGHLVTMSHEIRDAAKRLNIDLNTQQLELLEHIVLSHHGKGEFGSPAEPVIAEAHLFYLVNALDTMAGTVYDLWEKTDDGKWSEWSNILESRLKRVKI